ncbi:MAG: hypothetical protein B6A08_06825 [Sorangiineae bacterium NIC37A_2]|nr:MAG: hypothetical protein B6A08_06825 [Sorangiineae bacterium NIC37A_2]
MPPTKTTAPGPIRRPREAARKKDEAPPEPRRERRALSHVGGKVTIQGGSEEEQAALTHALDVSADEDEVMQDVHGFHSYPARLHPKTASRLIERLSRGDARVLDPFCGSGTVVVEARALGRTALGSDLNPLSVELAWLKSRGVTRKFASDLVQAAERIADKAEERRLARAEPYKRYDADDRERYPIHILLELDSIHHGIFSLEHNEPKRALRLVVSSLLTKLSYSEGDTTRRKAPRRLAPGFAIQLFVDKTRELAERLVAFSERVPPRTPRAFVTHADARRLSYVEPKSIDLIVTSPPYPGVYDYLDHHLHRLRWLGLRESRLQDDEIGARRSYRRRRLGEAEDLWVREIGACLREMRRVLASDGRAVMIVADSVVDRRALRAVPALERAAKENGVDIMAVASQKRPIFLHGAEEAFHDAPREEHVLIIRPGRAPIQRSFGKPSERRSEDSEARPRSRFDDGRPTATRAPAQRGPRERQESRDRSPERSRDARHVKPKSR